MVADAGVARTVAAYIALGANLDEPTQHVRRAMTDLGVLPHSKVLARSSLYETEPVGFLDQPRFINAVVRLDTALDADTLMRALRDIESAHGRVRSFANAPRTLDLDLLLYGDQTLDTPTLRVPHPRMHERAFVLVPLVEIAPACEIPGRGPARDWLDRLDARGVHRATS